MLRVEGVSQYYGESHILWDVALHVRKNACTCLMGRNGVGKTTLLQCIMGLLPLGAGRIVMGGVDITAFSPEKRAGAGLGYVPQGRRIFPFLTVEENLLVSLAARGDGSRKIPPDIFSFFPALKEMPHRRGGDLSGGQQQQLAMARALVLNPRLLVLDEPTEGIQPNVVRDMALVIRRLMEEMDMTVLLVEQKVPFARDMADSYAIMERGRITAGGPMKDLDAAAVRAFLSV
jgi:urea transport system ATP-binding protein